MDVEAVSSWLRRSQWRVRTQKTGSKVATLAQKAPPVAQPTPSTPADVSYDATKTFLALLTELQTTDGECSPLFRVVEGDQDGHGYIVAGGASCLTGHTDPVRW